MNWVLFGILLYIVLQLLVGVYCSRRIVNETDYLLAGRSLGVTMTSLSVFATWFGAETCIGAAGAVYEYGLAGATIDPFGCALCLVLMGLVFANRLWRRNLTTLADLFTQRYSPGVQNFAVLLIAPTSVMWAAAQVRAFGQVLSSVSGLDVEIAIAAAAVVVITYTMYGGLLADVVTDVVQGVALIIGLVVLFSIIVSALGGIDAVGARVVTKSSVVFQSGLPSLKTMEHWAIPIFGSLMSQELIARVLASRSPDVARRACVYGGLLYLAVGLIPVTIGLLGGELVPDLEDSEQILPALAQKYLHSFLYVIFAGALISAILLTVDSALLAASALLAHNLIVPFLGVHSDQPKIKIARTMVLISGIVAFALALNADRVYELVADASAFGSAGIFIVVVFGLFTSFGGPLCAGVTLAVGVLTWFVGRYALALTAPYLVSLGAAFSCYLLVGAWENVRIGWVKFSPVASWFRQDNN